MNILGTQIRRKRKELKLTVETLARKSGISPSTLSAIERGESQPTLETITGIVHIFDTWSSEDTKILQDVQTSIKLCNKRYTHKIYAMGDQDTPEQRTKQKSLSESMKTAEELFDRPEEKETGFGFAQTMDEGEPYTRPVEIEFGANEKLEEQRKKAKTGETIFVHPGNFQEVTMGPDYYKFIKNEIYSNLFSPSPRHPDHFRDKLHTNDGILTPLNRLQAKKLGVLSLSFWQRLIGWFK